MRRGNGRAGVWRWALARMRSGVTRDEIEAMRARHPIETVIAQYTELRRVGRVLKGRCPLPDHIDHHPSFVVYAADQHFYCFGCSRGGDVFKFLELVEGLNFREAMDRLENADWPRPPSPVVLPRRSGIPSSYSRSEPSAPAPLMSDEQTQQLTATATVYHTALLIHPQMLDYIIGRGIAVETIKRLRLGYATGQDLARYFTFRGWDLGAARDLGLLNAHGEFFQQRIVIPEWRGGRVIHLTGRSTTVDQAEKYLGLPGTPKPLYGLEWARGASEVYIVEGAFDMLTLVQWGYPAVALIGSYLKAEWIADLDFAERVYIVTDSDEPGRASAQRLAATFGERALVVPPLPGAKDVNELAQRPDGRQVFAQLVAWAPFTPS